MKTTDQPDTDSLREVGEVEEYSPDVKLPGTIETKEDEDEGLGEEEEEEKLPDYLRKVKV